MAHPSDLPAEVEEAYAARLDVEEFSNPAPNTQQQADTHRARRVQALTWHLAGIPMETIGSRLGISESGAKDLVRRTLARAENTQVEEMRALENARLDRAQAAIWQEVLRGDNKAINTFLRISDQRSRLNGLYAPTKIDLAVSVRQEMQEALHSLETLVLEGEVIDDGYPGVQDPDHQVEGTGEDGSE